MNKFIVIRERASGSGGYIISFGEDYDDLAWSLIERFNLLKEIYGSQISEDYKEIEEYVESFSNKKSYRKRDIVNFSICLLGVEIKCEEIFVGRKGFADLLIYLGDIGIEEQLLSPLEKNYDEIISSCFDDINERLWC